MIIVPKKWGLEEWLVNEPEYCGKLLFINKGAESSYHYHRNKKETFFLLKGRVQLKVDGKEFEMQEKINLNPMTPHKFKGLTDAIIVEVSTHHDDEDTYRL